jgi:hypothetical protein
MNRSTAIPAIVVIIGLPLWDCPSWPIAAMGAGVGAMALIGVLRHSVSLLRASALAALATYTLALWWSAAPIGLASAALFGLALLFLFDLTWFGRRFEGAEIAADVVRLQIRFWLERAAVIAAITLVLVFGAQLLALAIPFPAGSAAAGVGALVAFLVAVWATAAHDRGT